MLIPAHNEELVIADTIRAIGRRVPLSNVYVVSDGSHDETAAIARRAGARVHEIPLAGGKANALRTGLAAFSLIDRYRAVMLLDADTRLDDRYFDEALPLFDDPEVAAVAGCASTMWVPGRMSFMGAVLAAHRERVYLFFQNLVKYGQCWRFTNVVPIVPGFASLYRTSVLDRIRIDAPGLVIEDFNMTFDLHHNKLGRVGFTPKAIAYTQDPHRLRDYRRQVQRWTLGFWQTILRHGVWVSRFWVALALTILEVISAAGALLIAVAAVTVLLTGQLLEDLSLGPGPFSGAHGFVVEHLGFTTLLIGIALPDYVMTAVAAWWQRRPSYLVLGVFFLPLRLLDSLAAMGSMVQAMAVRSSGHWVSPQRKAMTPSTTARRPDAGAPPAPTERAGGH